ncbi:MAG: CDP-diacylglycerol--glycerol-3-phosphate 3-phosphatidyltransferase [Eubacteriaceae bacterium]|nr:CDP-diacylglycerol--glycerol-3-phosphate 3-phosphatidyltransferase [Eubacteriaceae bacterium]MBQ1466045.1 CDP-diacylglycerol--glycerol-3-phosphate 3-phosphatidyltransferase [Eubacteriaceae bacterium]MCR4894555.1 CDP-diacylglycerol--glycerol-3-phosphate 3-phosphatidyltransferase [Eubacteriales bacterium]
MKINKNLPNQLTTLRMILVPVYVVLFLMGYMYIAGAVFIIASFTDFLDGNIARKYNLVSDYGKFADPVADKILVLTAVILFCEAGRVPGWSVVIMVSREIIVMALRNMAVLKNRVLAADIFGKIKTMLQMCALVLMHYDALVSFFPTVSDVLYYASVFFTVLSGANYVIKNRDVISYETADQN